MIKTKNASSILFYLSLMMAEIGWMFTNIKIVSNICEPLINCSILLLIICCLIQSNKYSKKSFPLIIVLICSFIANAYITGNTTLLLLLLFCLACKNVDIDKLINFNWKFQLLLILVVIICYFLGVTNNFYLYRADGVIRSSMGFSHPNAFGMYLFSNFCQFLYCNIKKYHTSIFIIIGILLAYLSSTFSDSRGSVYSFIILIIFTIIFKVKTKKTHLNGFTTKILIIVPIILSFLSLVIAFNYNSKNEFLYNINSKLTGRISSASYIVNNYDVKVFGQKLPLVSTAESMRSGKSALVLDNAYIKLLYQYGILVFLAFIIFYCILIKKSIKADNWILLVILLVFAIRGLTGNILFNLYGNIFLLYFSKIMYGDDNYVYEIKK